MRAQMLTLDAAVAALFLVAAAHVVSLAAFKAVEVISHDILYRRLEAAAQHAVDVLLFGRGPWACVVGDIRFPGCVRHTANHHNDFFPLNYPIHCYVSDTDLQSIMGCNALPSNPKILYELNFSFCYASGNDFTNCHYRTATLKVWVS